MKFRDGRDTRYNSPWNIAVNFNVDMSFDSYEIESMIREYSKVNALDFDTKEISDEIYKFTGGYPFLVSRANNIMSGYNFKANFITEDNGLDMEKVLLRLQQFMKEK